MESVQWNVWVILLGLSEGIIMLRQNLVRKWENKIIILNVPEELCTSCHQEDLFVFHQ